MDENYLDNLLNEFSLDKEIDHKIEDELDNQMMEEKQKKQEENAVSKEDAFDMDLSLDAEMMTESDDVHFSEEQMEELDHLDHLADLDMDDLDFSDIDFEDLDITKLDDVKSEDFEKMLKDFEGDYGINGFFDEESEASDAASGEEYENAVSEPLYAEKAGFEDIPPVLNEDTLDTDAFDADSFLDTLLEETVSAEENEPIAELPEEFIRDTNSKNDELDDLFSMLDSVESPKADLKDSGLEETQPDISALAGLEGLDDLNDIEEPDDNVGSKKKKTFMEILFGEPDEDDVFSEEELAGS